MPPVALHISLTPLDTDRVELRYWQDNPNAFTPRTLAAGEVADLAAKAEAEYYAISEPDLVAVGKRLFAWLDGSDRWLARELDGLRGTAVALLIEAAKPLAHLPWEVLHDGTTFLVRGADPAVLPVRWKRSSRPPARPENRPLNVLFMATSPLGVSPDLNYEEEEGRILHATRTYPLALTVEETGTLAELADLVAGYPDGCLDVLHLTGHADHRPDGPRFLTESAAGAPVWVSAGEIAGAVPRRPSLVFLSGCRTAQSPLGGAVPSLADDLLGRGFPAVLGWGRPVFDADAIVAAAALYERLAAGFTPVEAVLHAHDRMRAAKARHWHLLRLAVAGPLPPAPVTAPKTVGRKLPPPVTHARRFLGKAANPTGSVVDRKDFVGRRRPLQRFIRALRGSDHPAGVVVHGLGGVGKSSLACRVVDRLDGFEPVVHVGVLDEPGFLRTLNSLNGLSGERLAALQAGGGLDLRLKALLQERSGAGAKKLLVVLDDFEQNTPLADGQPRITPAAQTVLEALVWAVEETDAARCLVTSRYKLTTTQGAKFYQQELSAMRPAEAEKKRRGLAGYKDAPPDRRKQADAAADGNPRLMEWIDKVLLQPDLDHAALLARLGQTEAAFREQILARELVAGLSEATRRVLAGLLVYRPPVPFEAVAAVFPGTGEPALRQALEAAAAVGLVEAEPQPAGGHLYRVPRLLKPLLEPHRPDDESWLVDAAAAALYHLWWEGDYQITESESLEVIRLGCLARRADIVTPIADRIGSIWL